MNILIFIIIFFILICLHCIVTSHIVIKRKSIRYFIGYIYLLRFKYIFMLDLVEDIVLYYFYV